MATISLASLDLAFLLVGIYLLSRIFPNKQGTRKLPPGPPGLPLIGNVLDIPAEKEWATFAKWQQTYAPPNTGDLVSLTVPGKSIIVINSYQKAIEMLEKKSAVYSDRPVVWMGGELMGYKDTLGLVPYRSKKFRTQRKLFHQELGTSNVIKSFYPQEEELAKKCLSRILCDPGNLRELLIKHAGAIILRVVYGYDVKEEHDDLVEIVDKAMDEFSIGVTPAAFMVNQIPWLRFLPSWLPGAGFKRLAAEWKKDLLKMVNMPFDFVKKQMAEGTAEPSFTSKLLQGEVTPQEAEDVKWTAATMYGGGGDTTAATFYAFFLAMTRYPEVQKRAKEEIDAVVGSNRLPSFEDRQSLPYIEAVCKEVLRFHATVPTGLPHSTLEDDIHDGYFIPKGSVVIANIWNMMHNPQVYKDPMSFNPSRFLGPNPEQNPRDIAFGFGRRICPGRLLADASIFITIATTLAVFDITPLKTEPPSGELTAGTICYPAPFKCKVAPRSAKAAELIQA